MNLMVVKTIDQFRPTDVIQIPYALLRLKVWFSKFDNLNLNLNFVYASENTIV
jgi:hypothetical protein